MTDIASRYVPVPLAAVRDAIPDVGHDLAAMMEFFADRDVMAKDRDIDHLRALHPDLMTFRDWLQSTGWDGTENAHSSSSRLAVV